jgi:hypothetical protein
MRTSTSKALPLPRMSAPRISACPRSLDGLAQRLAGVRVLAAQVDVTHRRADGDAGDGHALDQAERIAFHEHAVRECAGIALVGVAHDVLLRRVLVEHGPPLDAGRERGATATAQAGLEHFVHDFCTGHAERALEAGVAAVCDVIVDADRIRDPDAREGQAFLFSKPGKLLDPSQTQRVRCGLE